MKKDDNRINCIQVKILYVSVVSGV